jgi:hypothetical protein
MQAPIARPMRTHQVRLLTVSLPLSATFLWFGSCLASQPKIGLRRRGFDLPRRRFFASTSAERLQSPILERDDAVEAAGEFEVVGGDQRREPRIAHEVQQRPQHIVAGRGAARIVDSTDDDWRGALERNLIQTVRLMRLALPHMRARPGAAVIRLLGFGQEHARPTEGRDKGTGADKPRSVMPKTREGPKIRRLPAGGESPLRTRL